MRTVYALFLTFTAAAAVVAQQGQKFELNPATPEGQLLQKASQAATDGLSPSSVPLPKK